jgi:hypothetical protein
MGAIMAEKFVPEPVSLIPLSELMALANITDDDVLGAIAEWEADPPDPKFDGILKAVENADE